MVTSALHITGEVPVVIPEARVEVGFDELYRVEYPRLVRVAYALTGRLDLAEDLTQDAFAKAYTRWAKVAELESPGGYLRRMVVNNAMSSLRRRASEMRAIMRFRSGVDEAVVAPEVDGFWRLVRTLPPRQAQVVALYYADEQSTAEIAEVLQIAEGTVRATLTQARDALRTRVMEENNEQ